MKSKEKNGHKNELWNFNGRQWALCIALEEMLEQQFPRDAQLSVTNERSKSMVDKSTRRVLPGNRLSHYREPNHDLTV